MDESLDDLEALIALTEGKRIRQEHWSRGCYLYIEMSSGKLLNHKKEPGFFASSEYQKNSKWIVEDRYILVDQKDLQDILANSLISSTQRDEIVLKLGLQ